MSHKIFRWFAILFFVLALSRSGITPAQAAPPTNDNFADAEVIGALPFSTTVDTTEATTEPGEPQACSFPSHTVWYAFTPAETMALRLDVVGGTVVAYRASGSTLSDLTLFACASNTTSANLQVEAGQTYYLQADSFFGQAGVLQFNLTQITPPLNDSFANALAIPSLPFSATVDNTDATAEIGEPQNCSTPFRSVWYSFTPAQTMAVRINPTGSTVGGIVGLFLASGSAVTDLSALACAFDNGTSTNFQLEVGKTYYLRLDGNFGQAGALQINLEQISPPTNDSFANAQLIPSLPFTATVDNTNATIESGEPHNCTTTFRSAWYAFTPEQDMAIRMSMDGSTVASGVSMYFGPDIANLTLLACAFNGAPTNVPLEAGKTYFLRVDSFSEVGLLQINLEQIFPPANDMFSNAEVIGSLPFSATVDETNATSEPGEPQGCSTPNRNVWYSFTPAQNTVVQVDMIGSAAGGSVNVLLASGPNLSDLTSLTCAFTFNGSTANIQLEAGKTYYLRVDADFGQPGAVQVNLKQIFPPANDNFANAQVITSLPFSVPVDNTNATSEPGEPTGCSFPFRSVWYSFTPAETLAARVDLMGSSVGGTMNVFLAPGPGISDLTSVTCASTDFSSNIQFEAGKTYYLRVDTFGQPGLLQVNLQPITPPVNDNFADAEVITSLPLNATVDNTDATSEENEPIGCSFPFRSVWYSFTSAEDTAIRLDTLGSVVRGSIDIYLASGPNISDLTLLTCISDNNPKTIQVEAGKTYYFRIDSGPGIIQVNIQQAFPPANDNFANTEVITSLPFSATSDIIDATSEPNEPQNCTFMTKTVWYTFIPTETILVRADAQGGSIEGNVNIYDSDGTGFSGLQFLKCSGFTSSVSFIAEAGHTYYFQAGSTFGTIGTITLNLHQSVPPVNDDLANATGISSIPFSATTNLIDATNETDEPQNCYTMVNTVWYSFTPTETVKVAADTIGSAVSGNVNVYHAVSSGFPNLQFITCSGFGAGTSFIAQSGETYYLQVGPISQPGSVQFNLAIVPVLTGRITDIEGTPLPGTSEPFATATLYLICGDGCLNFVNSQQADSEGRFSFDSFYYGSPLAIGSYQITVTAHAYPTKQFGPFEFSGSNLDVGGLPLAPGAVIRGRALDAKTGNPLAGASVILHGCEINGCFNFVNSQNTDGDGYFQFNAFYYGDPLTAGTYDLEFSATSYDTKHIGVTVSDGENRDLGDVLINPTPHIGSISGRVVDALTGQPILPTFRPIVTLFRCNEEGCGFPTSMVTASDGSFRFETDPSGNPLPVSSYRIEIVAEQYFESAPIDIPNVTENEDRNVGDIKLNSFPIRFTEVKSCVDIPATGGDCVLSVKLYNGTDRDLTGKTWSLASASLPHAFAGYTNFQIKAAQDLDLGKGKSKVFRFRLNIPANPGPYGTYVCTRIFVGAGNQALFNTIGYRDLFCVLWNTSGFAITAAQGTSSISQANNLATVSATEVEPNNSCPGAQDAGAFSDPIVVNGNLDSSEAPDIDFFRFLGTPDRAITLDLEGASTDKGTLNDPFMGVFDSHCNLLDVNDNSASLNSHLEISIPADGIFVVAATTCCDGSFGGGGTGSYQLTVAPIQSIGSIRGMVIDAATQKPLRGGAAPFAFVQLLRCEQFGCSSMLAQSAGSDGSFRFDQDSGVTLRPGNYMIIAAADQYQYTQTDIFTVEADQNYNAGNVALTSYPIRFSETQVCSIPSNGGLCDFSVKITNGLANKFSGKAWSMIDASNIGSFTNFTSFQADSVRDVSLDPGKSTVLRFRFQVRSSVPDGAVVCATAFVGQNPGALFNTAGSRFLFCFVKGANGFTLLPENQMQSKLQHLSIQDMNRPNASSVMK